MKQMGKYIMIILSVMVPCFFSSMQCMASTAYTGSENTSNKIYRWTQVKSIEELKEKTSGSNPEGDRYRLLLLRGKFNSRVSAPALNKYLTLTMDDETGSFSEVSIFESGEVGYKSESFYTRGGLQTPYLLYMNEEKNVPYIDGKAPAYRLYATEGGTDEKSDYFLVGAEDYYAYPLKWETMKEKDNWKYVSDKWVITFPVQTCQSSFKIGKGAYAKETKSYVGIYSALFPDNRSSYNKASHMRWISWKDSEELFYGMPSIGTKKENKKTGGLLMKCYIGEEIPNANRIAGSKEIVGDVEKDKNIVDKNVEITYKNNTIIESNSVVNVKEGALLFISGNCFLNGIINVKGGTVVVQAGALVRTLDPKDGVSGLIKCSDGGKLIVRKGARIIGDSEQANIVLEGGSQLINKGCILNRTSIAVLSKSTVRNDPSGIIELGYAVLNTRKVLTDGYTGKKTSEFWKKTVDKLVNNYKKARKISGTDGTIQVASDAKIQNYGTFSVRDQSLSNNGLVSFDEIKKVAE